MVRQNAGHDKSPGARPAPPRVLRRAAGGSPRLAETAEGWFSRADPDRAATGAAGERRRRGLRVLEAHAGVPGPAGGLHGPPRVPERADVPRPARRGPDALAGAADHGGAEGQGPRARPLEPLPARERARARPDQPRVRASLRGDGALPDRAGGVQLLGAGHREHGGARPLRHRRAEARVARAAPGREDPLGLRDDRARRRVVGRDQHRGEHRPRRRRVRHQRPQVVDFGNRRSALQGHDLHGQDRPREPRPLQAAVDDPRAPGRVRHPRRPHAHRLRLRRRPSRTRRGRLRERAGSGGQPAPRRRARLRDRAGASRPGPDPPLHAADRRRRAGDRARCAAAPRSAWPSASASPTTT